eukprot:313179-Amphidinium_carterae.5
MPRAFMSLPSMELRPFLKWIRRFVYFDAALRRSVCVGGSKHAKSIVLYSIGRLVPQCFMEEVHAGFPTGTGEWPAEMPPRQTWQPDQLGVYGSENIIKTQSAQCRFAKVPILAVPPLDLIFPSSQSPRGC